MWYVRPAKAHTDQTDQSLCQSFEYAINVKLLTEHHLEFLNLKGGCTGSSESTHVKMPLCWKSHVAAHTEIGIDTVKPVLSAQSKIDKTKILMTNSSLMKVESIAECPAWSGAFCNTFDLH